MLKTEIGDIAGFIWNYLDKNGESAFGLVRAEIVKQHKINENYFAFAIGWLLRENNVNITADAENFDNSRIKLQ